jgi:hypothetical protein
MAQFAVIVQIFIAQCNPMNALSHQRLNRVLDAILRPAILETGRNPPRKTDPAIGLPQQQCPRIRGQRTPVKPRCDFPPAEAGEPERILATLCQHRVSPLL